MSELSNRVPVKYNEFPCYNILLEKDFNFIRSEIAKHKLDGRKIAIVTDSNVGIRHAQDLIDVMSKVTDQVYLYTFPAGEASKNLSTVQDLYEFLIQHSFDRNDVLMALGGGVVGDQQTSMSLKNNNNLAVICCLMKL